MYSRVVSRHAELSHMLASGIEGDAYVKAACELAEIAPIAEAITRLLGLRGQRADLEPLFAEEEMLELARGEARSLDSAISSLEHEIRVLLLPRDEEDARSAILEVRAGTGGEEAALFAAQLFDMYQRYSELHGWRFETLIMADTDLGGYREATAAITGRGVFERLKFESGAHRVQRVPETESQGRVHTSAATVAVLPQVEEVDLHIEDKDLRIDTYRASGAGGQHVNKTDSAVRITHLPTGIAVAMQEEKSQHKNRDKAMRILRARLYEKERAERAAVRAADRRVQVGSGDRSERIRTYNFPQGRVTDHRINLTLYKIERIMLGELDEVIEPLMAADRARRLAEMS